MKKRGKKIKHSYAVKPLGVKNTGYELSARAGLVAISRNEFNDQHLIDLYVLAEICDRLSEEPYIQAHVSSVKRIIERAHEAGRVEQLEYVALETSADMLLEFFRCAKNADIARVCLEGMQ